MSEQPTGTERKTQEPEQHWYVLKVQSGREESIKESLLKHAKIQGLEKYFGQIIVPSERVSEIKGGTRRITERKRYPGYIMVNMAITDETWYLVRSIPGVGDFLGSAPGRKPAPMPEHEVETMLAQAEAMKEEAPRLRVDFAKGDMVKVKEGPFENSEGCVEEVIEAKGVVVVILEVFGRPTPVQFHYWEVEKV